MLHCTRSEIISTPNIQEKLPIFTLLDKKLQSTVRAVSSKETSKLFKRCIILVMFLSWEYDIKSLEIKHSYRNTFFFEMVKKPRKMKSSEPSFCLYFKISSGVIQTKA